MRRRYRFVVLDLDGTILDPSKKLRNGVREAIARAQAAGLGVFLCTGRMVRSSLPFWRELRLQTPIIAYNGAMVKDPVAERVLFHRPLDLNIALDVAAFGRKIGLNFQAYENDEMFVERDAEGVKEYSRLYNVPYKVVASFQDVLREGATKLLAVCEPGQIPDALARLRDQFGDRVMLTATEGRHVEVCHPSINKAVGVQFVVTQARGCREEVVAVGDGMNDMEMLHWAGLGAAMANAPECVRRVADVIIGTNGEDGLARFLMGLIGGDGACVSC